MKNTSIVFEYLRRSASIESVATENSITQCDVVNGILSFLKKHPESSYTPILYRKIKVELTRLFLADKVTAADFAEKYGISEHCFVKLVCECIDEVVTTDALADKIYRRLLWGRNSLGSLTPKRVIVYLAKIYVSNPHVTQSSIGYSYNLSRQSISALLHRGVKESILEPALANAVANKAVYRSSAYASPKH